MGGHVAHKRTIFSWKYLSLGHKWEVNIKTDLQHVIREGLGWVDVSQGKEIWRTVLNIVTKCRFP